MTMYHMMIYIAACVLDHEKKVSHMTENELTLCNLSAKCSEGDVGVCGGVWGGVWGGLGGI